MNRSILPLLCICAILGCSSTLQLSPVSGPQQSVQAGDKLISEQFHTVAMRPRIEDWSGQKVLRISFAIKNGSSIETPLSIQNFLFWFNSNPLPLQNFERLQLRVLEEHDRLVSKASEEFTRSDNDMEADLSMRSAAALGPSRDPVTFRMQASAGQGETQQRFRDIEAATKRKLDRLDALYRKGVELAGEQTFDGFLEAVLPQTISSGDEIIIAVNLPPDQHLFKLKLTQ